MSEKLLDKNGYARPAAGRKVLTRPMLGRFRYGPFRLAKFDVNWAHVGLGGTKNGGQWKGRKERRDGRDGSKGGKQGRAGRERGEIGSEGR